MPTTTSEAYKMQLNDTLYKKGSKSYSTPMFSDNKFVIRYYIIGKAQHKPWWDEIDINYHNVKLHSITSKEIVAAHEEIEKYACIKFASLLPDLYGDNTTPNDFPVIVYSYYAPYCKVKDDKIGRQPGVIIIYIGRCIKEKQIELQRAVMQALGFIHEHRRPDRDFYVNVHLDVVEQQYWSLFERVNYNFAPYIDMTKEPFYYDYYSLTHFSYKEYGRHISMKKIGSGKNTKYVQEYNMVLEPLCKSVPKGDLGSAILSARDQKRLQIFYSCEKLQPIVDDVIRTAEGRNLFYYNAAEKHNPWGYRKNVGQPNPD
ncbi:tolloid-like protein 1 [Leptotrombidium deliense]|uniref:Metalloendopeptidase n=1 Tax=Leptotrombidium deliense TaxID=299467 RepID=A0A443S718_9ACAR|nr:tolloid-like protein 1 [Leptotrombidium deliense]